MDDEEGLSMDNIENLLKNYETNSGCDNPCFKRSIVI